MEGLPPLPEEVSTISPMEIVAQVTTYEFPNLKPSDKNFFKDLAADVVKKKVLSPKQDYWLRRLYAVSLGIWEVKKEEHKVEKMEAFTAVYALMDKAQEHLKYPEIRLQLEDGAEVALKLSGKSSKAPGQLNVTDGKPFGSNIWYGRVSKEGEYTKNWKVSEDAHKPVQALLRKLAKDPAGVAAAHGALTGRCCFCNIPLTNKKSTAAGFGEQCSKHYGLHEQWKKASAIIKE